MKIAAGTARGLEYLHDKASPPVIYQRYKPSNILVDEGLNVHLIGAQDALKKAVTVYENAICSTALDKFGLSMGQAYMFLHPISYIILLLHFTTYD
ncbi:unnamed protein product [Sphagnum tenellum]